TTITANGDDISNVTLMAAKPSQLTGRVVVDPTAQSSLPSPLMLGLQSAETAGIPAPPPPPARVGDDLTFEIKSPPRRMRVLLGGLGPPPQGWGVRAVRVNGIDVTDAGVEFKPGEDVSGVEVELTNKVTTVTGTVTMSGEASKDYTAIAFAQDKAKWTGAP